MRFVVVMVVVLVLCGVGVIDLQAPFDGSLRTTRFSSRARRGTIKPVKKLNRWIDWSE
jgi:hypothetical protein